MKHRFLPFLIIGCMILMAGACGEGPESDEFGATATLKKPTASKHSLIKEPTRPHPGWVCPLHPHQKSLYPYHNCPLDGQKLVRQGEWTCEDHPALSSTEPGNCPHDDKPLIKVTDLEKKTGKTIAELTEEAIAAEEKQAKK